MACTNCYNGCTEISSDRCIQYTGVDVPLLGILKGDSLSVVEQALITFLTSTINGSGIKISLDEEVYCELVTQYLQECSEVTALDLFKALVKAACSLQTQIDAEQARIDTIEANYTVDCLDGVAAEDGTHDIVQAIITKLCAIDASLTALSTDVDTNYVKISEINDYIAAYIASTVTSTRYSSRMVPYCPIPYIGSLSNFDVTGAGLAATEWEDIYLCNGLNGTPDLRGRTVVGAIVGVPGGAMSSVVNPASDPTFNPNYAVGDIAGANKITLDTNQIPSHTHTATVNDPEHFHYMIVNDSISNDPLTVDSYLSEEKDVSTESTNYHLRDGGVGPADAVKTSDSSTGITVDNGETGGGAAHSNIQPVLATYFIIYIP